MKANNIIVFFIYVILTSSYCCLNADDDDEERNREVNSVIKVLIEKIPGSNCGHLEDSVYKNGKYIILNKSINDSAFFEILRNKKIEKDLIEDFAFENMETVNFDLLLDDSIKNFITIIQDTDLDTLHSKCNKFNSVEEFWESFYKKFPNAKGQLRFSQVGFNKKKNKALVYYVFIGGSLCANFSVVILKKIRGKWKIEKEIIIARS
jgi:hypothetical protein